MCFYVNLRELWPFGSFFWRPSNSSSSGGNDTTSDDEKKEPTRGRHDDADDEAAADVDGKLCCRWNERELAPHWLLTSESQAFRAKTTTRTTTEVSQDQSLLTPASPTSARLGHREDHQKQKQNQNQTSKLSNYGSNLLASLSGHQALAPSVALLDGGLSAAKREKKEHQQGARQPPLAPPPPQTTTTTKQHQQSRHPATTLSHQGRAMSSEGPPPAGGEQAASRNTADDQQHQQPDQQGLVSAPMQSQAQQQQQHLREDLSHLVPEPSQEALEAASRFRVRTTARRHLDFDDEFELSEVGAVQRSKWSGPFHFIQAADCQFGMIDSYVHHRTEPGWREEIELCERLVGLCNAMQPRPAFMIICGDLVDSLPGSDLGRKQVVDFKRIFAKLNPEIPLVCVCGNHDVGDEPTPQTIADYRKNFGEDYFYFTKNDILFIVINSQFYQNRQHVQEEARQQDEWLERLLDRCRLFKYSFIFEHIPWFLERPDEDNDYFNIRKEVRQEWLAKFKRAGVTKIMCGHYHRNAGGWFDGMELVVTSAIGAQCGSDRSGIRIVRVLDKSIEHQYYAMEDVPLRIELGESGDGVADGSPSSQ